MDRWIHKWMDEARDFSLFFWRIFCLQYMSIFFQTNFFIFFKKDSALGRQ